MYKYIVYIKIIFIFYIIIYITHTYRINIVNNTERKYYNEMLNYTEEKMK